MGTYYLGLDIGTGSVGWAVTDKKYNLLKKKGKTLWGFHLFETAQTAEERRMFRAARRRLQRRKQRISLLQELFSEEIYKVDPGFFLRLKESRYVNEDKRDLEGNVPILPYNLFVDKDFDDKEYHKKYPTIYHLRWELMNSKEPHDIRLVYIALHHILKHRGHFLFEGRSIDNISEFAPVFEEFLQILSDELEIDKIPEKELIRLVEEILTNKDLGISKRKSELCKLFSAKTVQEKAVWNLIAGGTVKLADLFNDASLNEEERNKISFADNGYDEYSSQIEDILLERYILIAKAKSIYDWALLQEILQGYSSISEAKVKSFEKHKSDLMLLKNIARDLGEDVYDKIFGNPGKNIDNYSAYIGMYKINGRKKELERKRCSQEDFYKFLKKTLQGQNNSLIAEVAEQLEKGTFLPLQVIKDNGVIPYQIHELELNKMLENVKEYYPFLKEKDENGIDVIEKIQSIFKFRIPYYVGPLNSAHKESGFCWSVRNNEEKVYPWNFESVINLEESANAFIRRMTNKCTYLAGEDVLPKESILYSEFTVLNELNNLKINEEKISVELKNAIFEDLFLHKKKVNGKRLRDYLMIEGLISKEDTISGIDGDFKSSMKSYIELKELLTGTDLQKSDYEILIEDITLFGEDKKLLKKRIKSRYSSLSDKQVAKLADLRYQGWGKLSKTFLMDLEAPNPETGEAVSIIRMMRETNENLMQLLSKDYQFYLAVEEWNKEKGVKKELNYQTVEDLYVSPAVKRQIWQTIRIVKEIVKVMGAEPERVFVEMAREKQESKRTVSRKKKLEELYKKCKDEDAELQKLLGNTEESKLRSDRLYLYYTQKGKCMYSGETIDIEDLYNKNLYDVDHIYPQSKVMDDSLDNRVLVKKTLNSEKSDVYPIKEEIRQSQKSFWYMLLQQELISKEKYNRLIRNYEFEENELANFISRQLVETRQSTKEVANILKQALEKTEVVYVKAKSVSEFRHKREFIKIREMNDLHHAKDAYLNIVVGNVYRTKFGNNPRQYVHENPGRTYNLQKMFEKTIEEKGYCAWNPETNGSIVTVRKMMNKNNPLFTRRAYEVKGGLFDQQLMKKGKGQIAIKGEERLQDLGKYGGYNKAAGAYFVLVESLDKKRNKQRTIEFVPVYLAKQIECSTEALEKYCENELGLINPRILLKKIKIDTLFKVDGFYMHLSGRTGKQLIFKGAVQLVTGEREQATLKKIVKYVNAEKLEKGKMLTEYDDIQEEQLINLYDMFVNKLRNSLYGIRMKSQLETLQEKRDSFLKLSVENKCKVLYEILHLFQCQSGAADLSLIGGAARAGILVMANNISKVSQISIINQSITGIYEQEINLQTL